MRIKSLALVIVLLLATISQAQTIQLPTTDGTTINGISAGDYFGENVLSVGNMTASILPDYLIGMRNYPVMSKSGRVFLIPGNDQGNIPVINVSNPPAGSTIFTSQVSGASCGQLLETAGYYNNDRLKDAIIGCPTAQNYNLVFGQTTYATEVDLDKVGTLFQGIKFTGQIISSIRAADLDKDGYVDIVFNDAVTGRLFIYWGNTTTTAVVPLNDTTCTVIKYGTSANGKIELEDLDGNGYIDIAYTNNQSGAYYVILNAATRLVSATINETFFNGVRGFKVATNFANYLYKVGDLNDDQIKDLGTRGTLPSSSQQKTAIVFSRKVWPATVDFNTDTKKTVLTGVNMTGVGDGKTMSQAGDKNKDGIDDLFVSDSYTGRVICLYSKRAWPSTVDLLSSKITASVGFQYIGSVYTGTGISYIENISCGTETGLLIGSPNYGSAIGKAYLATK
jgi:hypothetical protein